MTAWIAIGLSLLALLLSATAYLAARREKRNDLFLALWQEYSSPETLECLQALYKLWGDAGGDPDKIAKAYVERFRTGDLLLHQQRRRVSFLFQKLAFMYYHDMIPREFRKEWLGFSLEVIAVLMPIETRAIPEILRGQPDFPRELDVRNIESVDFRRLFRLYNQARTKCSRVAAIQQPRGTR